MHILIAPDSFKGTLAALPVAQAIANGIQQVFPQAQIQLLPMADGGEGSLDAVLHAIPGERRQAQVRDLLGKPRTVEYALLGDPGTAVALLEAAQVVGLQYIDASSVEQRTTQGLGELLRHCLGQNLRHFLLGLGGSGSNDGGVGLLAALGVRFYAASGKLIEPTLAGLSALHRIEWSGLDPRLAQCAITLLTDVDNPLCGAQGATRIFGPQKGVPEIDLERFDARLSHFAQLSDAWAGATLSQRAGAGAAGGLAYALMLCGARRRAGAEALADLLQLDQAIAKADWVITGEGRSDAQTLRGKLPWVVAQHARAAQVPALLLSGAIEASSRAALAANFTACYALVGEGVTQAQAEQDPARYLTERAQQIAHAMFGKV